MHTIRAVNLNVNYEMLNNGIQVQRDIGLWAGNELITQLGTIFDEIDNPNEIIEIDSLDLEISVPDSESWKKTAEKILIIQLRKVLSEKITTAKSKISYWDISKEEHFFRALVYYLINGVLPWNISLHSNEQWNYLADQWITSVVNSNSIEQFKTPLLNILLKKVCQKRMVNSMSERVLGRFFNIFFSLPEYFPEEIMEEIFTMQKQLAEHRMHCESLCIPAELDIIERKNIYQILLDSLIINNTYSVKNITLQAITLILKTSIQKINYTFDEFKVVTFETGMFKTVQEKILESWDTVSNTQNSMTSLDLTSSEIEKAEDLGYTKTVWTADYPVREGIFIENAGLVIVLPFIKYFLERVDFLKNGNIVNVDSAVMLVDYLVMGSEAPAEFNLALPKIVCGLDIDTAITLTFSISEKLKNECDQLLISVIEHWNVLKDTSITGLREGFLRRSGKLSLTDKNEWLLQVEQKSYDMLLQKLPWTITMIKLPWMSRVLRTEWVY